MSVPATMQAWRLHAYSEGDPSPAIAALKVEEVPVPTLQPGQLLIQVHCAAVNPIDWKLFTGGLHGICPVTFPYTPGFDVSGTVVQVADCSRLAVGDEVCVDLGLVESCTAEPSFGPGGAWAQFCAVPESLVAKKGGLSFEQAAGLPLAGLTSWQALFTGTGGATDFTGAPLGSLSAGQKLLVLGGASATGAYAVQLAKDKGATVHATASQNPTPAGGSKVAYVATLGATAIDYKAEDWAEKLAGQEFDMIFDCVGQNEDWLKAPKVLKKGGKFFSIANFGPEPATQEGVVFQNFLLKSNATDLAALVALAEAGTLQVPVDSVVPFDQVPEALTKSTKWLAAGKIVIQVAHK